MEKKRIRYAEFPAPIKAKMAKGIVFGILAVILTGIIAYILSRAEIVNNPRLREAGACGKP